MRAKGNAIEIIDVRTATAVDAYLPMTPLPKRYAGKMLGVFELDETPETTNPAEAGSEGLDRLATGGDDWVAKLNRV